MCPDENLEKDQSMASYAGFEGWYLSVPNQRLGFPPKGTIAGALVVLDRLREAPDLDIGKHTAPGGAQIAGVGGAAVQRILSRHGESRRFLSEGGRTNRGLRGSIEQMLKTLTDSGFGELSTQAQVSAIDAMQGFLVEEVKRWYGTQRLAPKYASTRPIWYFISDLLEMARERSADGPVAEYLVGAKLQLRFPQHEVRNTSYSTADAQPGVFGDFDVGDTVFHVTVSPMPALYEKCVDNLNDGKMVYIVTLFSLVQATAMAVDRHEPGRIAVTSVEGFVSQNLDEMSEFTADQSKSQLKSLLETYNERVDEVEMDRSLLIKLPENLG